jgi:hypothetical protein
MITIICTVVETTTTCAIVREEVREFDGMTWMQFEGCDTSGVEIVWEEPGEENTCDKGIYMPLKPVFTDPRWY